MKRTAVLLLCAALPLLALCQKRVATYPFEFEKSLLARGDYDAYFLDAPGDSCFALILKDNKKAEYALLNQKFKVVAKLPQPIGSTVFDEPVYNYTGGTSSGHQFHFIYSGKGGYQMETVDFDQKQVSHQKLFETPKAEKPLVSFSDLNTYYAITANDKTSELNFYIVDGTGKLREKKVAFTLPEGVSKERKKLSTYLAGLKVFKSGEQPDLSTAVVSAKLFSYPDKLELVINDGEQPTHMVALALPDLNLKESFVDYAALIPKEDKAKQYISSFEKDNRLFSIILNKKNIRLAIHDLPTGGLLTQYEINEETTPNLFAKAPVSETRMGKRVKEKDVDDMKKLIKALTKGSEGLMVTENKTGQLVVTIGTYDFISLSSGGSGGGYSGGWQQSSMATTPSVTNHGATMTSVSTWNPTMYYRPGSPSFSTTSARYYNTTYFKLLLNPTTLQTARGRLPTPVVDQIKDYIETVDSKAKATNQFSIGKDQYYGYYDKDSKSYVIEQIHLVQ